MLRVLRPMFLALALYAGPMPAAMQQATPAPPCPVDQFATVGALRIADGTRTWSVCSPVEAYRSVIGASDDLVLIDERKPFDPAGVIEGDAIAYAASDGTELWRRSTAQAALPVGPVDGQEIVVLATGDGEAPALIGVDAFTGEERWRIATSDLPLVQNDTVVVVRGPAGSNGSSQVRGIDRITGDEVWVSDIRTSDQSRVMVARAPAAILDDVVVIPTGVSITAIDIRTGARLWQAPRLDHVAAAGGVFVGIKGADGWAPEVAALDAASGDQLWQAPGRPSYGGLLAAGDGVIVVLDPFKPELVAYELASGDERWRAAQSAQVEPQLVSGTSVVALWEGELVIASTSDGATVWAATQPFGSPFMNSVGSNGDAVFIAINSLPWGD